MRRSEKMIKTPFIIAWVVAGCCGAFAAAPTVWVVPISLLRVYPTEAPGSETTVTISCARGEYCAFQVATHAPTGGLTHINLSVWTLTGPGRALNRCKFGRFTNVQTDPQNMTFALKCFW